MGRADYLIVDSVIFNLIYNYNMPGEEFLNVEKIVGELNIAPNETIADFGAGHGFFTIAFAKRVGPSRPGFSVGVFSSAPGAIRSPAKN